MKNFRFITVLLTAIAVLTSCKEDVVIDNPVPFDNYSSDDELVVEIDGDNSQCAQTRVAYSGWATTFETGDKIGIYCWNGTSVVAANVPFTKQSNGTWTTATNTRVPYNSSYTYFCYFPYNASHGYTPGTSGNADTRFATFITDASNKFWKADQSTKANYDASNLMIAQGTHVGSGNKVNFAMDHKRGLIVINGEGVQYVDFSKYSVSYNYLTDYRRPYVISTTQALFLAKPNTDTKITYDHGDSGETIVEVCNANIPAGKYATYDLPIQYFKTTAIDNCVFTLSLPSVVSTTNVAYIEYSIDNGVTWTRVDNVNSQVVAVTTPEIPAGSWVLWRGSGTKNSRTLGVGYNGKILNYSTYCSRFSSTGRYKVGGFLYSLLIINPTVLMKPNISSSQNMGLASGMFAYLFYNSSNLVSAEDLLITYAMKSSGYCSTFRKCTSLTKGPQIIATKAVGGSDFSHAFNGCTSLTQITCLVKNWNYTNTSDNRSNFYLWVENVSSSGTFIMNSTTTETFVQNSTSGIPTGWTVETIDFI